MLKIENKTIIEKYTREANLMDLFDDEVIPYLELQSFERGEVILEAGSKLDYYYMIVEGEVKISYPYENGKSVLLKLYRPFNCFGDIELLKDIEIVTNVEAIRDTKLLTVPVNVIREKYLYSVNFLRHLTFTYANKLHAIINNATYNVAYPLNNRVASYLVNNIDKDIIDIDHSYQEMAEFLGTTYRHLNRVIKDLEEKQVIKIKNKKVEILNKEVLEDLAKNEYLENS